MSRTIREAEYEILQNPDFSGNPLIEAIGIGFSFEDFNRALVRSRPKSRKDALLYSRNDRESLLISLRQKFFVPNENHYALYKSVVNSLLAGYTNRNPHKLNPAKQIKKSYKDILNFEEELDITTNSLGSLFIGPSGIGKSTIINRIINLYPHAIRHSKLDLDPIIQVPFVKIECPKGSSIKELCVNFLEYLDSILQTNHRQTYYKGSRTSVYELVNALSKLTISHQIGVIFVDEIQNLINSPGANKKDLLIFFTKLNNTLNIPIIIIGTPEITGLIEKNYTLMRRWSGEGATRWNRLGINDDWEIFLISLLKYQYTDEAISYSQEICDYFYETCQGLIDLAIRLFVGAQRLAFLENKPCISIQLLNRVKKSKFWLEDKAIDEVRNKKQYSSSSFAELMEIQQEFKGFVHNDDARYLGIVKELEQLEMSENNYKTHVKTYLELSPEKSNAEIVLEILKLGKQPIRDKKTNEKADAKEFKKTDNKLVPNYTENDLRLCYDSDELKLKHKLENLGVVFDLKNSNLLM
jgi:hypothetical protein